MVHQSDDQLNEVSQYDNIMVYGINIYGGREGHCRGGLCRVGAARKRRQRAAHRLQLAAAA